MPNPDTPSSRRPLPARLRLILLAYNLFFPFVLAVLLPGYLARMFKRGKYRHKFGQRFGLYTPEVRARLASREWTWIHAVSVGEVLIALKLAAKMKTRNPELNIVLSTTTTTGFALAGKSASDWLEVIYNPLDFPPFVRRTLDLVRPRRIVLVEAEVWPNLTAAAWKRRIPLALVNARLSPRSGERFRKFRFFTGPIFQRLDLVCVQEPSDLPRWEGLGVDPERLRLTGSIKFDHSDDTPARAAEFRALLERLGVWAGMPVLLAGSTFPGEEKIMARILQALRSRFPGLFLILVPRHVERAPEVLAELRAAGLDCALRSKIENLSPEKMDCLLVDTTGELRDWYHTGTVIFIGKSLTATGGQNPVEAVAAGKPVLFGPHMENFSAVVDQWLARNAAIQVQDADSLQEQIARLLEDPGLCETMSANARNAIAPHQGATERTAALLEQGIAR